MMGWHIGINATQGLWQQYALGTMGLCVAMLGVMLPSSVLTYGAARWVQKHRDALSVISFKQGLAPIVVSSILATSWIITVAHDDWSRDWTIWLSTALTVFLIWKTQIHILWLLGAGAVLGAIGLI
jgi:chromate transporter